MLPGGDSAYDSPINRNTTIVAWIQNEASTFALQNASLPASERPPIMEIANLSLSFSLAEGSYVATFMDTATAEQVGANQTLRCGGGGEGKGKGKGQRGAPPTLCRVAVPPFTGDIALLITRRGAN